MVVQFTKAWHFSEVGKKTDVFARFSKVAGDGVRCFFVVLRQ